MSRAYRARFALLRLVIVGLLLTLLGRLWSLQVVNAQQYTRAATETRVRTVSLPAIRGQILDANGHAMVTNRVRPVVSVDYVTLQHQPDGGKAVLTRLAALLRKPYEQIADLVRLCGPAVSQPCWQGSPYEPIPVADDVDVPVALQITERQEEFPGVRTDLTPVRVYPYGTVAAHTLGYIQARVGRDGLEATYDRFLAGKPGTKVVAVNNTGKVTRVIQETQPVSGNTLVTSLDTRIQEIAERALDKAVARTGSHSGAAVVMESKTGRVTALASYPRYDPGVWTGGISAKAYKELLGPTHPLVSRAVQGEWAPGSTWKVTSVAAMANAGYGLGATYDCPSSYTVGNRPFRNFAGADLGLMTMHTALVKSCDTIFYRVADQLWQRDGGLTPVKRPAEVLAKTARGFGFGAPTGVDLPGEATGAVPDRTWKRATWAATRDESCRRAKTGYPDMSDRGRAAYLTVLARENCRGGGVWWAGDAANFAIGQGGVLVTPLQLARAYAAIANGGTLYTPRVGAKILRPDGTLVKAVSPPVDGRLPASAGTLAFIRSALAQVTRHGTAAEPFKGFPFKKAAVAGKTGTAESFGRQDTSWFASYAPDPAYVVVVVVSEGGRGAEDAAPAARQIWEGILGLGEQR